MIRENGTSTISVEVDNGRVTTTDSEHDEVCVVIASGIVSIRIGDIGLSIPESAAWKLRYLFVRALDESCAPAT